MFKNIGKIRYTNNNTEINENINDINEGVNSRDKYIIFKNKNIIKLYDRVCDHAGGQIIYNSRTKKLICPVHNWELDPKNGKYLNNNLKKKKTINYKIKNNFLHFTIKKRIPKISKIINKKNDNVEIRFINHAFLIIKTKQFMFATDPWATGPAFNNGWWLKKPSKQDWVKKLNECNFIYISHNHPDHLHKLTLSYLDKNKLIIIPSFHSGSTKKILNDYGFKNIQELNFNEEYNLENTNLVLSLFKSGDFREDSGIYFSINDFDALFDVDSNNINFLNLPNVNLYASSFAGGTSGYPVMFENYKEEEKKLVINRNINFIRQRNIKNILQISPNYFMPYAGFFEEKLPRDREVKKINKKNNILDYKKSCDKNKIELLNVEEYDSYLFKGRKLLSKKCIKTNFFKEINSNIYLNNSKKFYSEIDIDYLKNYFLKSKFKDNLKLLISLSDDNFKKFYMNFIVDFSDKISFKNSNKNINFNKINFEKEKKYLYLNARKESFLNVIYNKLPWEDLLIGFQCKVNRFPNIYNADFWYHFTNVYISDKHIRSVSNCNLCKVFEQTIDNEISKKNNIPIIKKVAKNL